MHLVIGAGEFLGTHITRALAAVVPVIELSADADDETLNDVIGGVDVVVFCAETVSPGRRLRYHRRPPASLQRVVEAARRAHVGRLIHVSTADVFGPDHFKRISETTPVRPLHAYERIKLFEEDWLLETAGDLEVVIVRPARVLGEGEGWILPRLVSSGVRGRLWLPGGGRARQTFIAAEDVGRACLAASDRGQPGQRYIVGGFDSTWRDVVTSAVRAVGFAAEIWPVPYDLEYLRALGVQMMTSPGGRIWTSLYTLDMLGKPHYYDDSYSRRQLTWSPSVGSFEQDMPGMTRWLLSLPEVSAALAESEAGPPSGPTSRPGR